MTDRKEGRSECKSGTGVSIRDREKKLWGWSGMSQGTIMEKPASGCPKRLGWFLWYEYTFQGVYFSPAGVSERDVSPSIVGTNRKTFWKLATPVCRADNAARDNFGKCVILQRCAVCFSLYMRFKQFSLIKNLSWSVIQQWRSSRTLFRLSLCMLLYS